MRLWLIMFICCCCGRLYGQAPYLAGSRADAMGGCALFNKDAWATHNNPAELAEIKNLSIGIWCTRKYNLRELSNGAITFAIPINKITMGIGFYSFGMSPWLHQQKINLALAMPIAPKINAGIGIHLLRTVLAEPYGSILTPIAEMAVQYQLNATMSTSIRFWNIYPAKMALWQNERLPMVLSAGINKKLSDKLRWCVELSHESSRPFCMATALDYMANNQCSLQAGFKSSPAAFGCGASFRQKKIEIYLGFQFQQAIGSSPGVSFLFNQLHET